MFMTEKLTNVQCISVPVRIEVLEDTCRRVTRATLEGRSAPRQQKSQREAGYSAPWAGLGQRSRPGRYYERAHWSGAEDV